MDQELMKMLKYLRLSGLLTHFDRFLEKAKNEDLSHVRLLRHIIEQEYKLKMENARKMKLCRAKIPEKWLMETFPFDRQPMIRSK
jgi:hypothetical protein